MQNLIQIATFCRLTARGTFSLFNFIVSICPLPSNGLIQITIEFAIAFWSHCEAKYYSNLLGMFAVYAALYNMAYARY